MANKVDIAVIGAGVIGLAVAREFALQEREVLILESDKAFGAHTSSRNSEVIHAGFYYPHGSLKAKLCVEGRKALYAYCESHGVGFKKYGKLVVATNEDQIGALEALHESAKRNGAENTKMMSMAAARKLEPEVKCIAAMLSPETGIIDSHALMLALLGDAEDEGARIAYNSGVTGGSVGAKGITLKTAQGAIEAGIVINCSGLSAQSVAKSISGFPVEKIPPTYYAKGSYFSLSRKAPFERLIYPMPERGGLGVHLTLDMGGRAKFGPDVEWVEKIDYTVDPRGAEKFRDSIATFWPGIRDHDLQPGYAGIRPKLVRQGEPAADFVIQGPREHGVEGLVNLFGIESPGLTSSPAIAKYVYSLIGD